MRFSITRCMQLVAGTSVVLLGIRTFVLPAWWNALASRADGYSSFGNRAMREGRLSEARSYFAAIVKFDPYSHKGYSGLASVATVEKNPHEAYHWSGKAISSARRWGESKGSLARRYVDRAAIALALADDTKADALLYARRSLADLEQARSEGHDGDGELVLQIQFWSAKAELRAAEAASVAGKHEDAAAHLSRARRFAGAALAREPKDFRARNILNAIETRMTSLKD